MPRPFLLNFVTFGCWLALAAVIFPNCQLRMNPLLFFALILLFQWLGLETLNALFEVTTWKRWAAFSAAAVTWLIVSVGLWNWGKANFAADRAHPVLGLASAHLATGPILLLAAAITYS